MTTEAKTNLTAYTIDAIFESYVTTHPQVAADLEELATEAAESLATFTESTSELNVEAWTAPPVTDDLETTTDTANVTPATFNFYRPSDRQAVPLLPLLPPTKRTVPDTVLTLLAFDLRRHAPPVAENREVTPVT